MSEQFPDELAQMRTDGRQEQGLRVDKGEHKIAMHACRLYLPVLVSGRLYTNTHTDLLTNLKVSHYNSNWENFYFLISRCNKLLTLPGTQRILSSVLPWTSLWSSTSPYRWFPYWCHYSNDINLFFYLNTDTADLIESKNMIKHKTVVCSVNTHLRKTRSLKVLAGPERRLSFVAIISLTHSK